MIARHMDSELRAFIQHADFQQSSVKYVAERLPDDDNELDRDIEQAIKHINVREFKYLTLAALVAGRAVDARHLATSISMLHTAGWLSDVALRMRGEVGRFLVQGLDAAHFNLETQSTVLCLAAIWCSENRNSVFPELLIPRARQLARFPIAGTAGFAYLLVVAVHTKDNNL